MVPRRVLTVLVPLLTWLEAPFATAIAQRRPNEQPLPASVSVEGYEPNPMLVVPRSTIAGAKYAFIDVHGHQDLVMPDEELAALVRHMDSIGLRTMVNLSGGSGERLAAQVINATRKYPGRFAVFANIDWGRVNEANFVERTVAQLERDVTVGGAAGLKVFKDLGMDDYWMNGSRVRVDDARFDPIWRKAADLGIPVLIHTAEPAAFFQPADSTNERYLELWQFPERARPPTKYPPFDSLIAEQHRVLKRNPRTTFISAHLS